MARTIFINLPVTDLARSKAFYEALGFRNEPKFSNDQAAAMVLSDTISVMLLTHDFYSSFTPRPIAEPHGTSQVLLCISCDSPGEVDRMIEAALANGGKADQSPKSEAEPGGLMYGRDFEDPDGHQWEPMWMDPAFAEQGAHPAEAVDA
jgi:predicted lactoylglutathione lyase